MLMETIPFLRRGQVGDLQRLVPHRHGRGKNHLFRLLEIGVFGCHVIQQICKRAVATRAYAIGNAILDTGLRCLFGTRSVVRMDNLLAGSG